MLNSGKKILALRDKKNINILTKSCPKFFISE